MEVCTKRAKNKYTRPKTQYGRRKPNEAFNGRLWWLTVTLSLCLFLAPTSWAQENDTDEVTTAIIENDDGQGWLRIASPLAILLSAVGSWIMVSRTIESNREIARNRATFDYLSRLSWDNDFIRKKELFLEIRASDKKMSSVAMEYEELKKTHNGQSKEEKDEILTRHSAVRTLLNEYEAIAVGIFTGTLSEEIVKRNHRQTIIDAVQACEEFIDITRKNSNAKEPEKI